MTDAKFFTYLALNHIVLLIKKNFEMLDPFLSHFFKCYSTNLMLENIHNDSKYHKNIFGYTLYYKMVNHEDFSKIIILLKKLVWTFS